ncbi:Uncharacterised protein [Vibrio cholerae]|nr:Uncharacterised protein [Vibrio cholerae]
MSSSQPLNTYFSTLRFSSCVVPACIERLNKLRARMVNSRGLKGLVM